MVTRVYQSETLKLMKMEYEDSTSPVDQSPCAKTTLDCAANFQTVHPMLC